MIDPGGDEMEGQLRPSPTGPRTSLSPLTPVPPIVPTFAICLAITSLTLIERSEHHDAESDYTDGRDSLYVTLLFDWCGPYSFELCGDSEEQPRKHVPVTIQPPTPPPPLPPLTTPHAIISKSDPPSLLLSVSRRKFVDDNDPV